MFRWIAKITKHLSLSMMMDRKENRNPTNRPGEKKQETVPQETHHITPQIKRNQDVLKAYFGENDGIIYRSFQAGRTNKRAALLVAVSGLVDKKTVNENVLTPIMNTDLPGDTPDVFGYLRESVLSVMEIKEEKDFNTVVHQILSGSAALFIEGEQKALMLQLADWTMRGVEQPETETVIRGPRDAFNEDISTNQILLRRRIHHPKLRFESMKVGTITETKVVISYLEGIANEEIVNEVRRRVSKIQVDAILESGYIEQHIEDASFSLFPTVSNAERPDIVAARLLEGRVAIFVDGTPIVLVVPNQLINHFHISEDYYSRPFLTNLIRVMRVLSFFLTIMLPGVFVSVIYHHPILIPFSLLVKLAKLREEVPFQLYIELTAMILVFEILRESGTRMPRPIGQAVSLVGALILGEAAVDAGLVSIPVVVVVAFAGVSSFLVNSLADAISILRIIFVIAGAALGLYGILVVGMVVVTHLASLRSFGVPYSSPLFPIFWRDLKDDVLRFPLRMLWSRPKSIQPEKRTRFKRGGRRNGQKSE